MRPMLATWTELPLQPGAGLLIVNSADGADDVVDAAWRAASGMPGSPALHVIAAPMWRPWIERTGVPAERVCYSVDDQGRPIELMHFLHTARALEWIVSKNFAFVAGSQPHNLYNEEVQLFERRVCLWLGDGHLFAHTLPQPYVYVFDAPALVHRMSRERALTTYRSTATALMDGLFQAWADAGRPAVDDSDPNALWSQVVEPRLPPLVRDFKELDAQPAEPPRDGEVVAAYLRDLLASLRERDVLVASLKDDVALRDRIIDDLNADARRAAGLKRRLAALFQPRRDE